MSSLLLPFLGVLVIGGTGALAWFFLRLDDGGPEED